MGQRGVRPTARPAAERELLILRLVRARADEHACGLVLHGQGEVVAVVVAGRARRASSSTPRSSSFIMTVAGCTTIVLFSQEKPLKMRGTLCETR